MSKTRGVADLTELELAVRSEARGMVRDGVEPTADRLADRMEWPDRDVRSAWHSLAAAGYRFRVVSKEKPSSKRLNIALHRIANGKGALHEELAIIARMSANAVKCRIAHAGNSYDSAELDGKPRELSPVEKQSLAKYYGSFDDPAVREWVGSLNTARRLKPDSRSAKDGYRRTA